eukprot:jgi/Psemu1/29904/gm1.29904_g
MRLHGVFFSIFITRPEIVLGGSNFFERSLRFLTTYNYLPEGGQLFVPLTKELLCLVFTNKKHLFEADLQVSFVSGEDERTLQSDGDSLIKLFEKIEVPNSQSYKATDIAKWDFMKKHLKNFKKFIEENDMYSVRWIVFTNTEIHEPESFFRFPWEGKSTDDSSDSSNDGVNTNNDDEEEDNVPVQVVNGNVTPTEPNAVKENASTASKKKLFLRKPKKRNKTASDKSNGEPKYKERKVSPNLGHVEDLGYLLQVPRPKPANVIRQKRSGNVKVLFADPDPVISYPKFAIGSEVTITGLPAPGTGVVKSYAAKKKDHYPQYPGYMVHKKLPNGTTVKRATWFPYHRVGSDKPQFNKLSDVFK